MGKLDKKYHIIKTAKFPLIFIVIIWAVKLLEASLESNFVEYGVLPRKLSGLKGILFSPFIHIIIIKSNILHFVIVRFPCNICKC